MANLCEDLVPPEGCVWRGATHWKTDNTDDFNIFEFEAEFGVPLHIYRCFKFPGGEALSPEETRFAQAGGILWYGFNQDAWQKKIDKGTGPLRPYANAIKSVAPAKVLVCPGWEPDGHCSELVPETSHECFGSAAQHREMRMMVKNFFDSVGVDNAVYIIDFSSKPSFVKNNLNTLASLYPEDGHITWTFFNGFQTVGQAKYEQQVAANKPQLPAHWSMKEQVKVFYDFFTENEGPWTGKPWGVGAWGPNFQTNASPPQPIDPADREKFLQGMTEVLTCGDYPNIKGTVYFNSLYSLITPEDVHISQKSDLAHGFAETVFPNSTELVPAFKEHLTCEPYMNADRHFGKAIHEAALDFMTGLPGAALSGIASIGSALASPFMSNKKVTVILKSNGLDAKDE